MENQQQAPVVPSVPQQPMMKKIKKFDFKANAMLLGGVFLIVALGVGTGFLLAKQGVFGRTVTKDTAAKVDTTKEAGIADESTFTDSAEGTIEDGGIAGEGTHHLVRDGGPSQTVYLTSTVINMDNFIGKKVKIWGQTISGKKAGWLMDVGKIKVIE